MRSKIPSLLGILLLTMVFIIQAMPIDSFAADTYVDPDATNVYLAGGDDLLDESKTEEEGSGGAGYYDNGTYTNRDLLDAGDYYVQKQFDWTDKENGKGKITFKTKLNVTKEPTRAVYAFTPCEAHGFLLKTAVKNIEYLLKNYDQVDLIWITGTYGKTEAWDSIEYWHTTYDDIHITKDVGGDRDNNNKPDYLDILQVKKNANGTLSHEEISSIWNGKNGLCRRYWGKTYTNGGTTQGSGTEKGINGAHWGISIYTGLFAYLAGMDDASELKSNPVMTLDKAVYEPTAIYVSFDGLLDTRAATSGVPYVQETDKQKTTWPDRDGNYSYPLINYNCWPILYSMYNDNPELSRYFSLGMNAAGKDNAFQFGAYGKITNYANLTTLNNTANTLHYQMWNELIALAKPSVLGPYIEDDGSFQVSEIPDDKLWNGVTRTQAYIRNQSESGNSDWMNFRNASDNYKFNFSYNYSFEDLDMPVVGINLKDELSDSFEVDGAVDNIQIQINYPDDTPVDMRNTTVTPSIKGNEVSFSVNSYVKGTELIFTIPVKVDDQKTTEVNKWLDTNKEASLNINLPKENPEDPDPEPLKYDVSSPKAHIEGYHIDTEVIGGTIDPDRDIREGGSCTINYAPKNENYVLDRITLTKYGEDGTPLESTTFDTPEALREYLESYTFNNVQNDWKIEVVFVEVQDITITKIWDDNGDAAGLRPTDTADLPITLTADPQGTTDDDDAFVPGDPVVTKNEDNTWTYKWTGLRKYSDDNGKNPISYTFAEDTSKLSKAYEAPVYEPADQKITKNTGKVTNKLILTSVEVTKEWNDDNNRDGIRPKTLDIKLLAGKSEVEGKTYTLKKSENWTYTFEDLPLKDDDTGEAIQYSVSESLAAESGYTKESITPSFNEEDGTWTVAVKNKHDLEKVSIPVEKVWIDGDDVDELRPDSVTVTLYADDKKTDKTLTLSASDDPEKNWKGSFTGLDKNKPGEVGKTITYTVKEEDEDIPAGYTAVVAETENGFKVTNTHVTYTKAAISGTKTLTGRDMAAGEFKFKVEAGDETTAAAVTAGNVVLPAANAESPASADGVAGSFTFGNIVFKEAGTYKFKVSEVVPDGDDPIDGITYDRTEKEVTITVVKEGNELAVKPQPDFSKVTFDNTYSASGEYTPAGEKTLKGQSETDDGSEETPADVTPADAQSEDSTPADTTAPAAEEPQAAQEDSAPAADAADAQADETVPAEELSAESDDAKTAAADDTDEAEATPENEEVSPAAEEGGDKAEESTSAEEAAPASDAAEEEVVEEAAAVTEEVETVEVSEPVTTEARAAGGATLRSKQPKGDEVAMAMEAGMFKFEIRYTNGEQYKDKKAAEGSNKAAAAGETAEITFDKLDYTTEKLKELVADGAATKDADGRYHISYYVVETEPDKDYYQNNSEVGSFNVVITDDGKGNLSVVTDPENVKISFTNRYITDTAVVSLDGLKVLNTENGSRTLKEGDFEFAVEPLDGAPAPENLSASNDAGGAVSFGEIEFTKGDLGDSKSKTFTYEITETEGSAHGMTYDGETKTVTITVTDDGEGKLTATTEPGSAPLFTFNNTYEPDPVSETVNKDIKVTKILKGADLEAGQFSFNIQAADDDTKAAVEAGKVVMPSKVTAENGADGDIVFDKITYNKVGTYTFRITEVIPEGAEEVDGGYELDGIRYDTTEYTAVVVVGDDGEGKLFIESQELSDGSKKAIFTNEKMPEEYVDPTRPDDEDDEDDDEDDSEGNSGKGVKTGDDSALAGWLALLLAAGAGGGAVYRRRRRED